MYLESHGHISAMPVTTASIALLPHSDLLYYALLA
jgi:hypothetical protein